MAIGPIQLIAIGFDEPEFRGRSGASWQPCEAWASYG